MKQSQIGLIGLAVMGQNLARNISRNHRISVYNRTYTTTENFLGAYKNENLSGYETLPDFINSLEQPRLIGIMVKAGQPIDQLIESLLPILSAGDILIDFGNSNFNDTIRREKYLADKNFNFFGCGVSGGEEGALNGPSLMPGGDKKIYQKLEPIFMDIAAKDFNQQACVSYIGANGAGHFVKMVHNGIEYGVMQMMAEAYEALALGYGLRAPEIADIFERYNQGKLHSYLFEIAIPILKKTDPYSASNEYLIDKILDTAGQKGTGTWTAIESLNLGSSLSVIAEAVYARSTSAHIRDREALSKLYNKPEIDFSIPLEQFIEQLENTLYSAMLISYAQGFAMFSEAAEHYNWDLNFAEISRIWQGGCIIRADLLKTLETAFNEQPRTHLLAIDQIAQSINAALTDFRTTVAECQLQGIPLFSLSSALYSFESMTNSRGSANFIQALRDSFGAHTFKRIDMDGNFHAKWDEIGELTKLD
ncbi:MAG: NADP-dependent phosphogluconate dehydrogenase [Gammaproteobacteria bacterium]|nr:NADP-dependent phosphogluconate dehydrogenase [Gammaproteobacteria bacterium]